MRNMTESLVTMTVNNEDKFFFLCTPEALEELACGNLLTTGMVRTLADLTGVTIDEANMLVAVHAQLCPVPLKTLPERFAAIQPLPTGQPLSMGALLQLARFLLKPSTYFGTHAVGVLLPDGSMHRFEDVGRHNAMDKAIGHAALLGADLSRCALCASGRISAEMLMKAYAVGIPVVATKRYPSDLAVVLAEGADITIVSDILSSQPRVHGSMRRIDPREETCLQ